MELISREEFIRSLNDWALQCEPDPNYDLPIEFTRRDLDSVEYRTILTCIRAVEEQPSVDWCSKCEMPERAKGKWVLKDGHLQCSNCNEYIDDNDMYPYCKWCGAKMEE